MKTIQIIAFQAVGLRGVRVTSHHIGSFSWQDEHIACLDVLLTNIQNQ